MEILSYIIPNVIIALILVCGVLIGSKQGWKIALIKCAYTTGIAVGSFFLSAKVLAPLIINAINFGQATLLVPVLTFVLLFGILMLLAFMIFTIIKHAINKKKAYPVKKIAKRQDVTMVQTSEQKAEAKRKRKANLRAEKIAWRKEHKKSRIFGALIGLVSAIVISVIVMLVAGNVGIALLSTGAIDAGSFIVAVYQNSAIGLLDKAIGAFPIMQYTFKTFLEFLV